MRILLLIICLLIKPGISFGGDNRLMEKLDELPYESLAAVVAKDFKINRAMSVGGVGVVGDNVYVVTKGDQNKAIYGADGKRWAGKSKLQNQVIYIVDGSVFEGNNLPENFDISRAILISFEKERIRFLDFNTFMGGFYER